MEREQFPSDPYDLPPETDEVHNYDAAFDESAAPPPSKMTSVAGGVPIPDWALEAERTEPERSEEAEPEPNAMLTEVTAPEYDGLLNVFANRESGMLIKIVKDDGAYITYAALDGSGRYSMPRADYDAHFAEWFRPAEAKDLARLQGDLVVPRPAGAPPDWR